MIETSRGFRFALLFFNCMLSFGSYFCFDLPSSLSDYMKEDVSKGGSGLTSEQYNLLFAVYAWTNALAVLVAGLLIDKIGIVKSMFIFATCFTIGQAVFVAGVWTDLFPVMFAGRLIFGTGGGTITIVQNALTAYWFTGHELSLAFGITLAFSRFGSVVNFYATPEIAKAIDYKYIFVIGACLCLTGILAACGTAYLHTRKLKELAGSNSGPTIKKFNIRHLLKLDARFWLLCICIAFFYNGIMPFVADVKDFLIDKYPDIGKEGATYTAGIIYCVSMVMSPVTGGIIDRIGRRGVLALIVTILACPIFFVFAFTDLTPYPIMVYLGILYSIMAPVLWPSIALVVDMAYIGTANGIATSIQMIGIGITNVVLGELTPNKDEPRGDKLVKWQHVNIYLAGNIVVLFVFVIAIIIIDKKRNGALNRSGSEKQKKSSTTSSYRWESALPSDIDSDAEDYNGETRRLIQ